MSFGNVVLRWSDDGGHTFSNRQIADIGSIGETAKQVMFRRLGSTRNGTGLDRIFELSSDAYIPMVLVGAVFLDD